MLLDALSAPSATVCINKHREELVVCLNETFRNEADINALNIELLRHGYKIHALRAGAIKYWKPQYYWFAPPGGHFVWLSVDSISAPIGSGWVKSDKIKDGPLTAPHRRRICSPPSTYMKSRS